MRNTNSPIRKKGALPNTNPTANPHRSQTANPTTTKTRVNHAVHPPPPWLLLQTFKRRFRSSKRIHGYKSKDIWRMKKHDKN